MMNRKSIFLVALSIAFVSLGCTIPRAGALKGEFLDNSDEADFAITTITESQTKLDPARSLVRFRAEFTAAPALDFATIRDGDRLTVTIFESMTNQGLFVFDAGRITFEGLVVDPEGFLAVPFAGRIPAEGLVLIEIRRLIIERLGDQILNPQVDIRVAEQPRGHVTLIGGQEPIMLLSRATQRLSAAIATARLEDANPAGTLVTLRRGSSQQSISLASFSAHATNDVVLRDGDIITFSDDPRHVVVLGAVGEQQRLEIPSGRYSLLAAIADMEGLDDDLADPSAVFLIRPSEAGSADRPIIVGMDSREPSHLIAAGRLDVADGDILFVSNAGFAQARKVLSAFTAGLGLLNNVRP